MVRYSNKSAKRVGHRSRMYQSKRRQINKDIELMVSSCPNLKKVNLVVYYKISIMDDTHGEVTFIIIIIFIFIIIIFISIIVIVFISIIIIIRRFGTRCCA